MTVEPAALALRELLSPRACAFLAARGAVIDPALRGDLALDDPARAGFAPVLRELHRTVAGLTWRDDPAWTFVLSPSTHGGVIEHDGAHWLAIGGSWVVFHVDPRGRMLEADELSARMIVADSVIERLEQLAVADEAAARFDGAHALDGRHGDRLAAERGLAPVVEASGAVRRWWAGATYLEEAHEPVEHLALERVWRTYIWER